MFRFQQAGKFALINQLTAIGAADRPEFDDVVGFGEQIEVVFDYDHGVPLVHQ